jgi:hypothetical protein
MSSRTTFSTAAQKEPEVAFRRAYSSKPAIAGRLYFSSAWLIVSVISPVLP